MPASCNVLVSSAGRRVGLVDAIRRDLEQLGVDGEVVASDMTPLSAASQHADSYEQVPPISSDEFARHVIDLCARREIRLVVPTIDTELPFFAAARSELHAAGTCAVASGPGTVGVSADKRSTADFLRDAQLPTVAQWDLDLAQEEADALPYPVIVKPARGSASIGVQRIGSASELRALTDHELVVQAIAPGREYTVDLWVDRAGEVRCAVPRRRIEVRAGEVSKGITEDHPAVIDVATAVVNALPDAFGPITVQVFADGDQVNVIEINPRFGGGFPLAWEAGARFTRWAIQEALGQDYARERFDWRHGLVMLRYDAAVFVDKGEVGL